MATEDGRNPNFEEKFENIVRAVRTSEDEKHFLIHPFGMFHYEVTASSLVKIDLEGNIVNPGSTHYAVNLPGWTLHAAVHAARPDVKCIIHVHTPAGSTVACMKYGLLRCSQESLSAGEVAYHRYNGLLVDEKESKAMADNLGPTPKIFILQNHGLMVLGDTIEEAYCSLVNLMAACETQVRLMSCCGMDNVMLMDESMPKKVQDVCCRGQDVRFSTGDQTVNLHELEFEAAVRMLDNMGLKSGYKYKKSPHSLLEKST
ncbi:alpha-adducin-like isoform X2 [Ptychodera flava]|uniref:alpha-adducin-like isoform X2 n=1 Tax=Ptychodera flava TaxID=63121 RepID=UPI00396A6F0F